MAMVLEVISMLKKLSLSVLAVLLLGGGVVAVKFVIPMYAVLDKVGPGTAPRDASALTTDESVSLAAACALALSLIHISEPTRPY